MKENTPTSENFESTYALLVRSEDKERNIFENAAYLVFLVSAVFSIWNMAQQHIELPGPTIQTTSMTESAKNCQQG